MNEPTRATGPTRTIGEVLAAHPLLGDLDTASRELMAGCAVNVAFGEGERLLSAGDRADSFWIVRHGQVDVEIHGAGVGTLTIDRLGPDDLLGVSWIADPYIAEFDATARSRGSAIRFDAACLRGKCAADQALGHELYRRFAAALRDRLHATRLQLLDLYEGRRAR